MLTPTGKIIRRLYFVEIAGDDKWHPFSHFVLEDERGRHYIFPDQPNGMDNLNQYKPQGNMRLGRELTGEETEAVRERCGGRKSR